MDDKFVNAFAKLDRDHDKVLSERDIDQAVIDNSVYAELAEIVAALKADFSEIKELHKDGWFARRNGITLTDILVFEQVLKQHLNDSYASYEDYEHALHQGKQKVTDPVLLAQLARCAMERVRDIQKLQHALYRDKDDPVKSIKPEAVRQGMVGDCYFLALLASIAATNPQMIVKMIEDNHDGTYTVTFPGARAEPVQIEAPTTIELALYARLTEWGTWPAVLEKAYGAFVAELAEHPKLIPAENLTSRDAFADAFQLLTGQAFVFKLLNSITCEGLCGLMTEVCREKRAMTAGSTRFNKGRTDDAGIPTCHAYSIIGWDPHVSKVTFRNPWGPVMHSEPELAGGKPLDGVRDGVFSMDVVHMLLNFDVIYYEDWAPDDRYIDSYEPPPGARVRNIGR